MGSHTPELEIDFVCYEQHGKGCLGDFWVFCFRGFFDDYEGVFSKLAGSNRFESLT